MKKLLFVFAFALVSQLGFSQEDFKADVMKVIEMSGSNATMDAAKAQVLAMVPSDKQAEFIKEFDVIINSITEQQAKNFMEVYTHDDIKAMMKFYESPVGKKMQEKAPILAEKAIAMQQANMMQIQGLVMKYMQ
ncbi:DUF2059 domain-containing protein [Flavobacterium okayamense]|uniref:DUF2059 domain-containing protein n=1 Tax=Flavobacterium okayamense TaxID=2830782 RepID=A0ABM7S3Y7_9FLAO|nr:DUF2059 domain-containing protein [Flavobacterium okayamense]BCY28226.1 hypothetical protein KK2020170_10940 [Flavobacterium okayamense]